MKGKSILFVDDDPILRMLLSEVLGGFGFSVLEAEDGQSGVDSFREHHPDLVLCDLHMPRMNGLDVLKTIRRESPNTPVVMLSAGGRMDGVVEALHLGAWDYLMKPLQGFDVLEHRLNKCFDRARLVEENLAYRKNLEETNARLTASLEALDLDERAARHIQEKLLPVNGRSFGPFRFDHFLVPSANLSGDFTDYFDLSGNRVGFYIADVSGHGASSAFVTVFLKMLMGRLIREYQSGSNQLVLKPQELCGYLNQELYSAEFGKYLTMIYGVLDVDNNQLEYTVAGHYPPPLLFEGGQCRALEDKGPPIGLFEKPDYPQSTLMLSEGCRLYLFSDGVLEIMSQPDLKQKEAHLMQLCRQTPSISELVEGLGLGDLSSIVDDVTLLKLEVGNNG